VTIDVCELHHLTLCYVYCAIEKKIVGELPCTFQEKFNTTFDLHAPPISQLVSTLKSKEKRPVTIVDSTTVYNTGACGHMTRKEGEEETCVLLVEDHRLLAHSTCRRLSLHFSFPDKIYIHRSASLHFASKVTSNARAQKHRRRRPVEARLLQELDLKPRSLPQRLLPRGDRHERPREEACYQALGRRCHGGHARRGGLVRSC
jgi:hypothetical protein